MAVGQVYWIFVDGPAAELLAAGPVSLRVGDLAGPLKEVGSTA